MSIWLCSFLLVNFGLFNFLDNRKTLCGSSIPDKCQQGCRVLDVVINTLCHDKMHLFYVINCFNMIVIIRNNKWANITSITLISDTSLWIYTIYSSITRTVKYSVENCRTHNKDIIKGIWRFTIYKDQFQNLLYILLW